MLFVETWCGQWPAAGDLLCGTCDPAAIRALLREQGFENLWDDGMQKVLAGLTTPEEVHGACRH